MGSALVRVGVRQHARPESISKRAPSTCVSFHGIGPRPDAHALCGLTLAKITSFSWEWADCEAQEVGGKRKICPDSQFGRIPLTY